MFTLLWLISSAAWADGVSKVKKYSDPVEMWENDHIPACQLNEKGQSENCWVTDSGDFASLNVSIVSRLVIFSGSFADLSHWPHDTALSSNQLHQCLLNADKAQSVWWAYISRLFPSFLSLYTIFYSFDLTQLHAFS